MHIGLCFVCVVVRFMDIRVCHYVVMFVRLSLTIKGYLLTYLLTYLSPQQIHSKLHATISKSYSKSHNLLYDKSTASRSDGVRL